MAHPSDDDAMDELRAQPFEWRRRGLMPPIELEALIARRLSGVVRGVPADPTYADFFVAA
ncbi:MULTISPECIES: hypothetical protein [unclassified Curtobacterium]|uniref:hypothetical protein n=1 Tax=unclassified Curtobacterium TaxID=257496 RepID=UPI000DA8D6CC|nr:MULTISPECIES: hypothetical protein [unclassified Curtobacterium]PZF34266.1 hypothetical protein DEJ35_00040 [Curtobacterium sp. MCPF17_051]WIB70780.1 hypothetical protein DEI85_16775 [Curtobacterium sp. MCBD17_026]